MATEDCPGYGAAKTDVLAMGCWAEHEDGSLAVVESTEANRVIFSLFDPTQDPVVEYRHAMPEDDFKMAFSWKTGNAILNEKWTWHDKTPFPWDRVIKDGLKPGMKFVTAQDQISAAQRVAEHLGARAEQVRDRSHLLPKKVKKLARQLAEAILSVAE